MNSIINIEENSYMYRVWIIKKKKTDCIKMLPEPEKINGSTVKTEPSKEIKEEIKEEIPSDPNLSKGHTGPPSNKLTNGEAGIIRYGNLYDKNDSQGSLCMATFYIFFIIDLP